MGFFDDALDTVGGAISGLGSAVGLGGGGGGIAGAIGGGGAAPAHRGEARGGGADPDKANFTLGWDPSATQDLNNFAGGTAQRAIDMGGTAGNLRQQAGGAGNRAAPILDQAAALRATSQADTSGVGQGNLAAQIAARAGQTTGSGAQAVRAQGTNDALNAALALAGSGGGLGGSAAAMSQAMGQAPAEIARAANDAAGIQAQADQADAARQLGALQGAADVTGAQRGQTLQTAGLLGQLGSEQAQNDLAGMSLNDQLRLGLGGLAQGYDTAGLEGQLNAGQLGLGAQNLGLQGAVAGLQGTMGYEDALNQLYGIDSNQQLGSRQIDVQKGKNIMDAIGGIGSAVGGLAMMSDARSKKNIEVTRLRDRFAAISGGI